MSAADQVQIVQDYLNGDGCNVLSRRYGISENGALHFLKEAEVELRPQGKVTADDVAQMARLRAKGWTYQAIGERFGVTRAAVSRRLSSR